MNEAEYLMKNYGDCGALDNIHSLFKQNIKSCNAKWRRHAMPEKGEKQQ